MIAARYSSLQSASVASTRRAPATPPSRRERRRVAAHLDPLLREHRADRRQELRRHRRMHEQRLGGIAGAQLLRLGVVDDRQRHRQVGGGVDVDMAVAVEVLQHRHLGLAGDALDQALAAARDDEVDRLRRGDQEADRGPVGGADELHRVGRQAGLGERFAHQRRQRQVRLQRFRAAAQDAGVAALDGERRRLDRHVRPALVDHREDADRHPHPADPDAARLLAQAGDLADRIGHRRDLLAAEGDGLDRLGVELEAVDQRRVQAGGAWRRRRRAGSPRQASPRRRAAVAPGRARRHCARPPARPRGRRWQPAPRRPCARSRPAGRRKSSADCRKPARRRRSGGAADREGMR